MTKSKIKKRIGRDLDRAVSSDLLLQQAATEKTIKNYDRVGIPYDKKIYNRYIQNLEAQKIASQSQDKDLKIKLSNRGKQLFKQIKESTIPQQHTNTVAVSSVIPSQVQDTISPTIQATPVDTIERKILSLVTSEAYRCGKTPTHGTITRWAKKYANNDRAMVIKILDRHYAGKDTKRARKLVKQEKVNYASAKTQLEQAKLQREREAREREREARERERDESSSSVKPLSTIKKNKILRSKVEGRSGNPETETFKNRILKLKDVKSSGINMDDVTKFLKKNKKK